MRFEPCGSIVARASEVAEGTPPGPEKRIGARTGSAISAAAAIPPCQSPSATRVTAAGESSGTVEGKVASAAPAAFAAALEPPTRVVFLVAKAGKPRSVASLSAAGPVPGAPVPWICGAGPLGPRSPPESKTPNA